MNRNGKRARSGRRRSIVYVFTELRSGTAGLADTEAAAGAPSYHASRPVSSMSVEPLSTQTGTPNACSRIRRTKNRRISLRNSRSSSLRGVDVDVDICRAAPDLHFDERDEVSEGGGAGVRNASSRIARSLSDEAGGDHFVHRRGGPGNAGMEKLSDLDERDSLGVSRSKR